MFKKYKINESSRRVYACNYADKTNPDYVVKHPPRPRLEKTIDRDVEEYDYNSMNEDVDNIILIAVEFLSLPPYMADRTKLIMAKMWEYPDNFHDMKYENVILGIMMHVVYSDSTEEITVDFNKYCAGLFGQKEAEININQMYKACEIVDDLYLRVEQEVNKISSQNYKRGKTIYTTQLSRLYFIILKAIEITFNCFFISSLRVNGEFQSHILSDSVNCF